VLGGGTGGGPAAADFRSTAGHCQRQLSPAVRGTTGQCLPWEALWEGAGGHSLPGLTRARLEGGAWKERAAGGQRSGHRNEQTGAGGGDIRRVVTAEQARQQATSPSVSLHPPTQPRTSSPPPLSPLQDPPTNRRTSPPVSASWRVARTMAISGMRFTTRVGLVAIVAAAASAAVWGAPAQVNEARSPVPADGARAPLVSVGVALGRVTDLTRVVTLRAPNKGQEQKAADKKRAASKKAGAPTNKSTPKSKWAPKQSPKKQAAKPPTNKVVKPSTRLSPGPSQPVPDCRPLRPFLVEHYMIAWRLAMLGRTAAPAMRIFIDARRHAATYVRANPKSASRVCGLRRLTATLSARAVALVKAHRDRRGPLPKGGKFRGLTKAERTAMNKVLAVPLSKAVPAKLLPKTVSL